ncbi:hypothetical protein, partial [uncultured Mailhella sp.]|uniref:hypothetical protein n=1 Tax=uncultured Mailhella sp. TaxID=1981031 RepID=UPI002628D871
RTFNPSILPADYAFPNISTSNYNRAFENNFGVAQRPGTLLSVCLPPFTPQVVNEIAMAKAIPTYK